jgi:type II secretory pathway pseudopilin PulG
MNKVKTGFTLAEALLTLGIIGILSAMIVPQLVTVIAKKKAGAVLGRTVEQIELGFQNVIQKHNDTVENGSYYSELTTDMTEIYPIKNFAPYIGGNCISSTKGTTQATFKLNKSPATVKFYIYKSDTDTSLASTSHLTIDVNGDKNPNKSGVDQFGFYIKPTGKLIPYGTATKKVVRNGFKVE